MKTETHIGVIKHGRKKIKVSLHQLLVRLYEQGAIIRCAKRRSDAKKNTQNSSCMHKWTDPLYKVGADYS